MCIGGPALIYYVMPSEEELFLVSIIEEEELDVLLTSTAEIQPRATKTVTGEQTEEARGL